MKKVNQLTLDRFYHLNGLWKMSGLATPELHSEAELVLPINSVYHHLDWNGIAMGPATENIFFQGVTKPVYIKNISQLSLLDGHPRPAAFNAEQRAKELRQLNRRLKPLMDFQMVSKDPKTLIVFNYDFLHRAYRYPEGVLTDYHHRRNLFATLMSSVAQAAQDSITRQHFIMMPMPEQIPSISELDKASKEFSAISLKYFPGAGELVTLEMWKWLGEDRQSSLMKVIRQDDYSKINLVFDILGKWTVTNLY